MACDLRGFFASTVLYVRLGENPCAAGPIEKAAHLGTENPVKHIMKKGFLRTITLATQKAFFVLFPLCVFDYNR